MSARAGMASLLAGQGEDLLKGYVQCSKATDCLERAMVWTPVTQRLATAVQPASVRRCPKPDKQPLWDSVEEPDDTQVPE